MKRPLHEVIECLKLNRDSIFIWVICEPDRSLVCSLRVGFAEASAWCVDFANKHGNGLVPFFFSGHDVFLGFPPVNQ